MAHQPKRAKRYTDDFRSDAVALFKQSNASKASVAKRLSIDPATLTQWIKQSDIDAGRAEGLSTAEREELRTLRRENKILQMERDLMKKAAAFFAQDGTR